MGYATSPFGQFPFGIGSPTTTTAPATGDYGSPYIDPAERDYEIDSDTGQLKQMPTIRQRVLLIVSSEKGSSLAEPEFGLELPPVIDGTFESGADAAIRSALAQLVDVDKVIRIDEITFAYPEPHRADITIVWTILATNKQDQVTI